MKTAIMIGIVLLAALTVTIPTASAGPPEPECFQVYPWSELCKGDAGAVICYYLEGVPEELCGPIR